MKLLITGTHRELGRAIADALIQNGHTVTRLLRTPDSLPTSLQRLTFDGIVHADITLGATRDRTAIDDNLFGARRLRAIAEKIDAPVVALSSIVAQGPSSPDRPHGSDAPSAPLGMIARSILSAETLLWTSAIQRLVIFRLAVPYGCEGAFSQLCRTLKKSPIRPIVGNFQLSFIHIMDVAKAIEMTIERKELTRFRAHLSDGVIRTGSDLLNGLESTDEVAIRIPVPTSPALMGIAGELSRPFGSWEMALHLKHGACWTSQPNVAEDAFNFTPSKNWRAFLNDKL